jgi:hypothetical protein
VAPRGEGNGKGRGFAPVALAAALAPALLTLAVAALIRVGVLDWSTGFDGLVMTAGRYLGWAALAVALVGLLNALGDFRARGAIAVAAVVIASASAGLHWRQSIALGAGAPADVSSDPADPPGQAARVEPAGTCAGVDPVPAQLTARQASNALLDAGFAMTRSTVFQVEGVREGFWFGHRRLAIVRIRPGRTDIRVIAEHPSADGGGSCRLAARLSTALQAIR